MRHGKVSFVMLAVVLTGATVSAITITGLTPATVKVKVGQPVIFTLTATGVPAQGPPSCFFALTPGDGSTLVGPEAMTSGFTSAGATLEAFSYKTSGTFTVHVTPRAPSYGSQNPLLTDADESFVQKGATPCDGAATATVIVWDPYTPRGRVGTKNLSPVFARKAGPKLPGPGPVEMTTVHPGAAVALNPQPLPPGAHTDALRMGGGASVPNGATRLASVPYVRAAGVLPASAPEGEPVRLAVTADQGCNAVRIAWGDGSTQDQSLDPRRPGGERPIQHVYRKPGMEMVKVAGEHGCYGQATASVTVTMPMRRPMGNAAPLVHR